MALAQDIVTRIINVQWGEGLAVEFTGRPSYLRLARQVSMNKVILSFWFRISGATVLERGAGVVPLLMFGPQQTGIVYDSTLGIIGYVPAILPDGTSAPVPIYGTFITGSHNELLRVSTIGVRLYNDSPDGSFEVHIQTKDLANGANLLAQTPSATWEPGWNPDNPVDQIKYTYVDASYAETTPQEIIGNGFFKFYTEAKRRIPIKVNQWHHVLLSWDLRGRNSVHGAVGGSSTVEGTDAYSLLWCAVDDRNWNKYQLPALWIGGWGYGDVEILDANPNAMLSNTCHKYAGLPGPVSSIFSALPQVSVSFSALPSNPIFIPGGPTIVDNDLVQMAELQIFSGLTLDTSKEINRRAFIDFKRDADGNPNTDKNGKRMLMPVDPKQAIELLGKKPDILLHGSKKWQDGKNTGSMGIDNDGEQIPAGQFSPSGKIVKYLPDPEISES